MATFALVHGACHGAWCWERLHPELEALGHRAVAMDLPCDDSAATASTYAQVVVDALAAEPDDLILVGHSLAGVTIPLVAARRPVGRMVFLCAAIAQPGRSLAEQMESETEMLHPGYADRRRNLDKQGRTHWDSYEAARETFYSDCDEADARAAFERLRPQALAPYAEVCPLESIPAIPRTYVLGRQDRILNAAWARQAAPERLGVEPLELDTGHSPLLSRPGQLAELLGRLG